MRQHDLTVELIDVDRLSQHPDNANNGDLDAIEQSIDVNGFYQPILVQRRTGFILAGNHRYQVACKQQEPKLPVIYLDVSDEEAARIMLADNRTTRKGHDDESALFDMLDMLHGTDIGLLGTGYSNSDYQYLIDLADQPLQFPTEGVQLPPAIIPPNPKSTKPFLGYQIEPQVDGDGEVFEITLTRTDLKKIGRRDLNRVRKALGHQPLSDQEFDTYGMGQ